MSAADPVEATPKSGMYDFTAKYTKGATDYFCPARLPPASFDIVFLDPPFGAGLLWPAVEASRRLLAPGGLLYAETDEPVAADEAAAHGLEPMRSSRAGRVCFHLLRLRNA